ncbi:hypothetical protein [Actinomadura kijaniata]|uniref:hypothetical protein n=1 Tax=Actinomadura kijaniata TaxID=46161 RepID=UPI0009FDCCA5|nr:hypothetical protein [Actinomadura kijaniata]
MSVEREWLRDYMVLALRVDRLLGGGVLDYRGPAAWKERVAAEEPVPAARLADEADRLLAVVPTNGDGMLAPERADALTGQLRAIRAVARRAAGEERPVAEYVRECLGIEVRRLPEEEFEEAHEALDAALPKGGGSVADRLHAWRRAHRLPDGDRDRLPGLVERAARETRDRTRAFVGLPADDTVDCQVVPRAHFLAAGAYLGGRRGTIFVNGGLPFNLADLLMVVAHEGYPGHIAEALLKEIHLVEGRGWEEQRTRFLLSPQFVLSEGMGLHAHAMVFAGDEGQRWLHAHVLPQFGIAPDGSDFAAIHDARDVLWGAWGNAVFLSDEGRSEEEVAAYLTRWGLLEEHEVATVLALLASPFLRPYVFGYYHGRRLLQGWLAGPERNDRYRRLLTEPFTPRRILAELPSAGS